MNYLETIKCMEEEIASRSATIEKLRDELSELKKSHSYKRVLELENALRSYRTKLRSYTAAALYSDFYVMLRDIELLCDEAKL